MKFKHWDKSSTIKQKSESQNGCYKKTKQVKLYEKQTKYLIR